MDNKHILKFLLIVLNILYIPEVLSQSAQIDSIKKLISVSKEDTNLANRYIILSELEKKKRLLDASIKNAEHAISLSDKLNFQNGRVNGRIARTNSLIFASRVPEATTTIHEAINLAKANKDYIGLGNSYNILAKIYANTGNLDSIEIAAQLAIDAASVSKDSFVVTTALNFIGLAEQGRGEYSKAIETLLKCLKLSEQINDSLLIQNCLGNIANVHNEMKNNREALRYHFLSLDRKLRNKAFREVAISYSNIGAVYQDLAKIDSFKYYTLKAYQMADSLNENFLISIIANNLSGVFEMENDLDSSLYYNNIAFETNTLLKNQTSIILNLYQRANINIKIAKEKNEFSYYHKALTDLNEGLELAHQIKDKERIVSGYKAISIVYEELNQPKQSLKYLKLSYDLNDSLKSIQFSEQIAEMQTKYETEKKDKEITANKLQMQENKLKLEKTSNTNRLLTAGIAGLILLGIAGTFAVKQRQKLLNERKEIEKQKALEQTRAAIARDLHDDIGATLSSMQLMSSFASTAMETNTQGAKQWIQKIGVSTGDLSQNIRDIVWTLNPSNDNTEELILRMKQFATQILEPKNIQYTFTADEKAILYLNEIIARRNIFLILKEALNNTAKYSECDTVTISLALVNTVPGTSGSKFEMVITDNGKGFDASATHPGNGLKSMSKRAEQLNGIIKINSSTGNGTTVTLIC